VHEIFIATLFKPKGSVKMINLHNTYDRLMTWGRRIIFGMPVPAGLLFWVRGRLSPFFSCMKSGIKQNLSSKSLANLRRNTHRLEKGLSHRVRRKVFGLTYIEETVDLFAVLAKETDVANRPALLWSRDVLNAYFNHVSSVGKLAVLQQRYQAICDTLMVRGKGSVPLGTVPYSLSQRKGRAVPYQDMYDFALWRRSIRHYQDKFVEISILEKAVCIAALSPSACNRQPFKFHFYNRPDAVDKLSRIPGGMTDFEQRNQIPCIAVLTIDYADYFHERDMMAPVIDAGMAAMSFMYALESLGVSSVSVNWPLLPNRYRSIRSIVKLSKSETPVLMFAIGYPATDAIILASVKKDCHALMRVNGEPV